MDIGFLNQRIFLKNILKLRNKIENGLNTKYYKHIKPGQDETYVNKIKENINTYLWIKSLREKN